MINIKKTIYENINYRIDRLTKLADNNPVIFKKLLFLIILDDLFDWADYRDDSQKIQKRLQKIRQEFLYGNPEIKPAYDRSEKCDYVNVNTPQTNSMWLNIFDQDYSYVDPDLVEQPCFENPNHLEPLHQPFLLPYYKDNKKVLWLESREDQELHVIDGWKTILTDQEKVNYYIDEYERLWYLDTNECKWVRKEITLTEEDINTILEQIPTKIKISELSDNDDDRFKFVLDTEENSELDIMDESEIEDLFNEEDE